MLFVIAMCSLVSYAPRLPMKGETIMGSSFETNFGGKGANQAVQCARLGINVSMCGKIGSDSYGDSYYASFQRENVDVSHLLRPAIGSSRLVIIIKAIIHFYLTFMLNRIRTGIANINVGEDDGSNTIILTPGVNTDYSPDDVAALDDTIRLSKVVICQNEIPGPSTHKALQLSRDHQTISIFNPAPAHIDNIAAIHEMISLADIVCPNEGELSLLTNLPTDTDDQVESAAKILLDLGCEAVAVTLGGRGAYVCHRDPKESTSIISYFLSTEKVNVVDTVGAGDSFIGTLASYIARGTSLKTAIKRALYCASQSVTRKGSQKSYSFLDDINAEFRPPTTVNIEKQQLRSLLFSSE